MTKLLSNYLKEKKQWVDMIMPSYIEKIEAPEIIKESMIYSLNAGGKRLRPILLFATLHAFGKDEKLGIDVACALEMIHTYSLIHDDLPSMDDDDLRRGKPTNHKVYGEAVAILAGDGLLTHSFEIIAKSKELSDTLKANIIAFLAQAAGPSGMVGGQVADLLGEQKVLNVEELEYIHEHKTGKLLRFAVVAGAIIAGASKDQQECLDQFARHLGLAFQIKDDILDIEGDVKQIGKPVGSDVGKDKSTYPKLLTLEGAKNKCNDHLTSAKEWLEKANVESDLLLEIADYIVNRDH
ncbi:farnesyl-diphosphate synthase [Schinkia azotoformans MEV2011]|uniref:Farnesyl diphosphate synthase n=1 Tax=Schinkia azotoformans MEV2011 TaxID=1348973 RepID=A0A072NIR2_SCHAZ|nr:farnesyl diphosphate synthase [Schinkia azotoformans]KEF37401.1 farnesyl-diphosphate synthase [Schinkia azotoformans MEV2011]MEC1694621.1 polyprenyl synthetase family protein [Schinkia azotoformans]MEC1718383.1 polyprenyl synthetase family protein [Schinkia azotoformans]MEC1725682.1 polyprenyl synthetase family protein [Schinkia azotoformans]MEC1742532.1 polyprenyl synthetase family protein [Schinkia azotoformans]